METKTSRNGWSRILLGGLVVLLLVIVNIFRDSNSVVVWRVVRKELGDGFESSEDAEPASKNALREYESEDDTEYIHSEKEKEEEMDFIAHLSERNKVFNETTKAVNISKLEAEDAEFSLFKNPSKSFRLVFIKLYKVGGTSVSWVLQRLTFRDKSYRLAPQNIHASTPREKYRRVCRRPFTISAHHASRSSWMKYCLPGATYVTVIRNPIDKWVSMYSWKINRSYFIHYPDDRPCNYTAGDTKPRTPPYVCHDDSYRKEVALNSMLRRLQRASDSPHCSETCHWLTGRRHRDPERVIKSLRENYSFVGVTEHIDSFLVLLALRYGWPLEYMYYDRCKSLHGAHVSVRDIQDNQWALEKLRRITENEMRIYEWAKQSFESYIKRLGPEFEKLVKEFQQGLKEFQAWRTKRKGTSKRWVRSRNGYC